MPRASRRSMPAPAPRSRRGRPRRSSRASPPSPASASAWSAEAEALARILTSEVGKPIAQSRNELEGRAAAPRFLPRRDRARAGARARARRGRRSRSASPTSRSASSPTSRRGTIRGSWAATCSCRRSLAGNAVLYKPSEFASLTGLEIARLLHGSGRARGRVHPGRRRGRRWAPRSWPRTWTACSSPGSYATGQRIAAGAGRAPGEAAARAGRQGPGLRVRRRGRRAGRREHRRRRVLQHRPELLLGRAHLRARAHLRGVRRRVRGGGARLPARRSAWTKPPTSARSRAPRRWTCWKRRWPTHARRARRCSRAASASPPPGNWFEPTVLVGVDHSMAVMRDESFGPVIGLMRGARRRAGARPHERHRVRPHRGRVHPRSRARRAHPRAGRAAARSTGTAATA